jgi:hypothetical protein
MTEWGRAPVGRPARTPRPVFHNAREPVVLIRGARATRLREDIAWLPCRRAGQLLTKADNHEPVTPVKPACFDKVASLPILTTLLPSTLPSELLTEFATLDQYPTPAKVTLGTTELDWTSPEPDRRVRAARRQTAAWTQPWTPLYLLWSAEYFAIPYKDQRTNEPDKGRRNWVFDGQCYTWHGQGDTPTNDSGSAIPRVLSGRILLSPTRSTISTSASSTSGKKPPAKTRTSLMLSGISSPCSPPPKVTVTSSAKPSTASPNSSPAANPCYAPTIPKTSRICSTATSPTPPATWTEGGFNRSWRHNAPRSASRRLRSTSAN